MKIKCDKQQLSAAIMSVSYAVSPKSSLTALEGILLTAGNGKLQLTGYDLELGITTSIDADVYEEGQVILQAKLFADIVRRMPGESVSLSCDQKLLCELRGGVAQFTILGLDPQEFPELPQVGDASAVTLPQRVLSSMLGQVLFAVATTDAKPVHTGALFVLEEGCITIVSVDGYRLALRREKADIESPLSFIVPGKTLSDVLKLLGDTDDALNIQVSKKHIIFHIGECCVVSRLLEGEFLDYKTAIPSGVQTSVLVNTREYIESVERASLLISDRLKSPLREVYEADLIKTSCSTTIGKVYDEIPCSAQGSSVEMGFNNRYLLDALKNAGCDQVRLEINGPLSPMKVVPPEGDSFLFLVLPVRLKNE